MRFFSIIELFRSNIISLELTQPEAEILYPMLLPTAQQNDPAALIIGNSLSDWTALSSKQFKNIIFISNGPQSSNSFRFNNSNCLSLDDSNLSRAGESVLNIISYAIYSCNTLLHNLRSDFQTRSLSRILGAASSFLQFPLLFLDPEGNMIDCAGTHYYSSWSKLLEQQNLLYDSSSIQLPQQTAESHIPIYIEANNGCFYLLPIRSSGRFYGVLASFSSNKYFDPLDRAMLSEFSFALGQIIPHIPGPLTAGNRLSYLFRSLLLSKENILTEEDEAVLAKQHWLKDHRFCVYCIRFPQSSNSLYRLQNCQHQLASCFPYAYLLAEHDCLYMIYNLSLDSRYRRKEIVSLILANLRNNSPIVGIGNAYRGIEKTFVSRRQAELAIDIGTIINQKQDSYDYDNVFLYHLFMSCNSHLDLLTLIHPLIQELLIHDQHNGTEYTITLREFLNSNMKITLASERLHIHKNTMEYRLRRIQELTHPRFEESNRVVAFQLSFSILNYLEHLNEFEQLKKSNG